MNVVRAKSAAWVAAGAVLTAAAWSATAATAHALPVPDRQSNGVISVRYYGNPVSGVTAQISDDSNPDGVTEVCVYSSIGTPGTAPLPFSGNAVLNGKDPGSLFIPGDPIGGHWNVTVHCDGTNQSFSFFEAY
jgi:hypothetical protein